MGILVLSSLMAISFSLATILFIEVRTSSDLTKTEGALAGANGVAEQALYNIKRSVDCDENCYQTDFSNHVALNGEPESSTVASPTLLDKVEPASNNLTNTKNKYDFCSTNTPPNGGCGYGKVVVTYEPSGNNDPLVVNLCEFDASGTTSYDTAPCTDLDDDYWQTGHNGQFLASGQQLVLTLTPGMQQQLILYNYNVTSTQNIYVQIQTFDTNGTTPKGLPYANKTSVSINALNGLVGRKIKVVVPNPGGSSSSCGPGNDACFVGANIATQGNWQGVYGSAGYDINSYSGSLASAPSYGTYWATGNSVYEWCNNDGTCNPDARALQIPPVGTSRIAGTWYSGTTFDIDVNITDGNTHQVAIYMVDWDTYQGGRVQTVDVLDGSTLTGLDSQSISNFTNGKYYVWNVSGHVIFRITNNNAPSNAVVSGIFFD